MKQTFYFSHDYNARSDEKIVKLLQIEKWEGYGIYWAIVEKLYEAGGFIDEDYDCIAYDLRTDCERIERIINNYKLFIVASKKISSKSVSHRLSLRKGKSDKARQSAKHRWNKGVSEDTNAMRTQCERNAIKERKGKESKVKEITPMVLEEKPQSFGREDINQSIETFKKILGGSLDGTIAENRKYAKLLIDKLKKDYPKYDTTKQIQYLIEAGHKDDFHGKNATSFKYLYYNAQKIIQSVKNKGLNKSKNIII